jgi:endonuclease G
MHYERFLRAPLAVLFLLAACVKTVTPTVTPVEKTTTASSIRQTATAVTQSLFENFESGSKTAYAEGDVAFSSGTWTLNDALVGTSASDAKNGTRSIRVRNTGTIGMDFDVTTGASTVTVLHAVYGADGSSTWGLWVSANGGSTYTQVGSAVTSSSTTLSTATFTVNQTGTLRFQVRKISGGTNRINIDDLTINSNGGSGGGTGTASDNSNMLLGNPSGATTSTANADNYLQSELMVLILGVFTAMTRVLVVIRLRSLLPFGSTQYICTVKDIENATGYTLLSNVPAAHPERPGDEKRHRNG